MNASATSAHFMKIFSRIVAVLLVPCLAGASIGPVGAGFHPRPQSEFHSIQSNDISGRHGGLPLQFPFASQALDVASIVGHNKILDNQPLEGKEVSTGLTAAPVAVSNEQRAMSDETGNGESSALVPRPAGPVSAAKLLAAPHGIVGLIRRVTKAPMTHKVFTTVLAIAALWAWFSPLMHVITNPHLIPHDFLTFYVGSKLLFFHHMNPQLYAPESIRQISQLLHSWNVTPGWILIFKANGGYWNSPLNLILFAPLVFLRPAAAYIVFQILARVSFMAIVSAIVWRVSNRRKWQERLAATSAALILASLLHSIYTSMAIGQIEAIYLAALVGALFFLSSPRQNTSTMHIAAGLLALATFSKVYPALFVAMLLAPGIRAMFRRRSLDLSWKLAALVLAYGLFLGGIVSAVVGSHSIMIWVHKYAGVVANTAPFPVGLPDYLRAGLAAAGITLDWLPPILTNVVRALVLWPSLRVFATRARSSRGLFLRASILVSLLPTLLPHWMHYYNAVFILPVLVGFILSRRLPAWRQALVRTLLIVGFIFIQGFHYAGRPLEPYIYDVILSPIMSFSSVPLPPSLAAFGQMLPLIDPMIGDLLAYPATLAVFFALMLLVKGLARPFPAGADLVSARNNDRRPQSEFHLASQGFGSAHPDALSAVEGQAHAPKTGRRTLRQWLSAALRSWMASIIVIASWGLAQAQEINVWVPYFHPDASRQALQCYGNRFSELSIFALRADKAGKLAPAQDFIHEAVTTARALEPRPRILLTATNDTSRRAKDPGVVSRWIGRPKDRARHIQDLISWVDKENVDGIDIDYENVRRTDSARFTSFIAELAAQLHARGKYLTVTVEPKMDDTSHPIDWRAIAPYADRVRVMAYQYHGPRTAPGLISPLDDVAKLADYALTRIPAGKLEIALAMYGFDWPRRGKAALVGTRDQFDTLANLANAEAWLDSATGAGRISYIPASKRRNAVRHEVWMETPASLVNKIDLLRGKGITKIGVWQLDAGDMSGLFTLLAPSTSTPEHAPSSGSPVLLRRGRVGAAA